jgi:hypothetical protein
MALLKLNAIENLCKNIGLQTHSDDVEMDRFDKLCFERLKNVTINNKLRYLYSNIQRGRVELVNNLHYFGFASKFSGVHVHLNQNINNKCHSHFYLYETREINEDNTVLQASLRMFCNCYDEIVLDLIYADNVWLITKETPFPCHLRPLTYSSIADLVENVKTTYVCSNLKKMHAYNRNEHRQEPKRLQAIAAFFIGNFFYNEKIVLESILPTNLFNYVERVAFKYNGCEWCY